ncbi:MAG: type IV pilus modification protein PilV [Thiohalocapsa sp.]
MRVGIANPVNQQTVRRSRCRGFSMLEILIAAVVFSIGAIGATGMQILAAQSNSEAMQRTQAVYLATDIMERMHNNSAALDSYDTSGDNSWTILGGGSITNEPSPACDTANCTPQQQAAHDLWAWERAMDGNGITRADVGAIGGLQSPTGCIRHTGTGRLELAIAWLGRQSMTNATVAQGCTVVDRYGDNSEFRRIVHLRTLIAPPS